MPHKDDLNTENGLRAIVIADSFNNRFRPITLDCPRALLPLANVPLLEYTFEFLSAGGVTEIFVYCRSHEDQIKDYLEKSKWNKKFSPCIIHTRSVRDVLNIGDVIRTIANNQRTDFQSDFILVNADIVSNLDFKAALTAHKERCRTDPRSEPRHAMTIVMKQAEPNHRIRSQEDDVVVALDDGDRLFEYLPLNRFDEDSDESKVLSPLQMPTLLFKENPSLMVRSDLIDCHVAICSPLVLELFVDNFDYDSVPQFVRGVMDDEINDHRVHTHIITKDYAARVSNLNTYQSISTDILHRWSFPFVPDVNMSNDTNYKFLRNNVYTDNNVTLARSCDLKKDIMVGSGTVVGTNTKLDGAVIGRNCKIGAGCTLKNCYIWDNVIIGDNCVVKDHVFICYGAQLKDNVTIEEKVILANNVCIESGRTVEAKSRLYMSDSKECAWQIDEDDSIYAYGEELEIDVSSDEFSSDSEAEMLSSEESFTVEVKDSIKAALSSSNISADNVILEINSSKHAYNITVPRVMETVLMAMLTGDQESLHLESAKRLAYLQTCLKKLQEVLTHYFRAAKDQLFALSIIEDHCLKTPTDAANVQKLLQMCYNLDFIAEEVIIRWYQTNDGKPNTIKQKCSQFVTWLEEASEEESSEEESE